MTKNSGAQPCPSLFFCWQSVYIMWVVFLLKMLSCYYAHQNVVLNAGDRFCINYLDNFSWDIARTLWLPSVVLMLVQNPTGIAEPARIHGFCRPNWNLCTFTCNILRQWVALCLSCLKIFLYLLATVTEMAPLDIHSFGDTAYSLKEKKQISKYFLNILI